MWISALLAMILKYAEIVLTMIYRRRESDGAYHGCATDYIGAFWSSHGLRRTGRAICIIFSLAFLLCSLTMGSMLQSSAISEALCGTFEIPPVATGIILAVLTLYICMSGTLGIVKITNLLVPIMSVGYVLISLAVIIPNAARLTDALSLILRCAFSPSAAAGGVGGYAVARAVRYGVMRGLVSNEAGCGTAPCAHAIAECSSPAKQGAWGIFEVFVDTVVLCTLTALVVILEYDAASAFDGNYMMMTVAAFSARLGNAAAYFLCAAVLCFGFATVLCWAHYGLRRALTRRIRVA
jgi:AGCS family alanine or glycine:cation symporter